MASACAVACPANAQTTGSGSGEVVIVTPLSVVKTEDLQFGAVIPGASGGTVTINPFTEARTTTGSVIAYGGTVTAAKFSGLSVNPSHLKIDVPAGNITITHTDGLTTMTVSQFGINGNKNDWVTSNEVFSFNVGARLNVGANQKPGFYTGQFTVTVNYR